MKNEQKTIKCKMDEILTFKNIGVSKNRIMLSPMDTLMGDNGKMTNFHMQHYLSRAYGGVGIIIVEATSVSKNGYIKEADLGLWNDEQRDSMKSLVSEVKKTDALIGIQLNHAGDKILLSSNVENSFVTTVNNFYPFTTDAKLEILSDEAEEQIINDFVSAAKRAKDAGFDFVMIHAAHGYLLHSFISQFLNKKYRGPMVERAKIVIDIVKRINDEIGIPIAMRITPHDMVDHEDCLKPEQFKEFLNVLTKYLDFIDVSTFSGASEVPDIKPEKFHNHEFAEIIKTYAKDSLIGINGYIGNRTDIDTVLKHGDIATVGQALLKDPNFVINSLESNEIDKKKYKLGNGSPWFNYKTAKKW